MTRRGYRDSKVQLWKCDKDVCREYVFDMTIKEITELPDGFEALLQESLLQNFNFLKKMQDEWFSGKNRFNKNGERAFAAFIGDKLVGIGGLNRDPYLLDAQVGRVRHLYVAHGYRHSRVGTLLMNEIIKAARMHYRKLRLRTDTDTAAQFYESLGFHRVRDGYATHELVF